MEHNFQPFDKSRRELWILASKRAGWDPVSPEGSRVCSAYLLKLHKEHKHMHLRDHLQADVPLWKYSETFTAAQCGQWNYSHINVAAGLFWASGWNWLAWTVPFKFKEIFYQWSSWTGYSISCHEHFYILSPVKLMLLPCCSTTLVAACWSSFGYVDSFFLSFWDFLISCFCKKNRLF